MTRKNEILLIATPEPELDELFGPSVREYRVKVVDSLKELFIAVRQETVGVLVMDACLAAGMDFEAIPIIKGLDRNIPIIVTTEENNPELESAIRKKGIFYYHLRMFGSEELMLAVSNAMRRASS